MMSDLDIAVLLEPLEGDTPCGESLIHDAEYDAIRNARRADDASVPAGVWQKPIKVADWQEVEERCSRVLSTRSKDLTIAAWLGEAWLNRHGLLALPQCLRLVVELCERYWGELYPLPRDGDLGFRAAPLTWMARAYPDLLAMQVEIFSGAEGLPGTLGQWKNATRTALAVRDRTDVPAAQREASDKACEVLQAAARATPASQLRMALASLEAAKPLVERLDAWCAPRLEHETPSFAVLFETMSEVKTLLMECLAMHPDDLLSPQLQVRAASGEDGEQTASSAGGMFWAATAPTSPTSREIAYRQLELIVDFLARYEPHSPVPYLIRRALEWGKKPLPELLRELISGDVEAQRLWTFLGVVGEGGTEI
ncbi:type VI secretion system protein TssA [Burkholderia lata]|uniref:Type VI secretion system protein TssA n=1 Tax=Burkholderia lata (strain ATCC 17760 / DSM 23089 / LMG 22485 / NCIMB 9086 / R18194 / 383) TaxID=482957 RepID=A0A6P2SW84_BURL3|nr:type VI secretion system protein TssA [Burkholderia lata]VWC49384.1 type VI secretion system protein TssA [Burkholderia lata]